MKNTRKIDPSVEQLYIMLNRLGYYMTDVCAASGVPPVTPSRWYRKGLAPREQVFNRVLAAMVDMGIKDGKLPERARGKSVDEVLEMGVIG